MCTVGNITDNNGSRLPLYLLVAGLVLLPFLFSTATMDATLAPRFIFLGILITLLAASQLWYGRPWLSSQLVLPFLVFVGIELVSLLLSAHPREGLWGLLKDAGLVVYLVLFIQVVKPPHGVHSIVKAFVIVNAVLGFYALYQLFSTGAMLHPGRLYEVTATMGHRNLLASALLLTLPFVIYNAWCARGWYRWLCLVLSAHSSFLIFVLESRSSWLGLGVLIVAYMGCIPIEKLLARSRLKFWKFFGLAVAVGVLTIFIWMHHTYLGPGKGAEVTSEMGFAHTDDKTFTIDERVMLWRATLRMIGNEGIMGVGPQQWKIQFPAYGSDIWRARQGMVQFQRPHNDYLWVAAELGIPGLVAYLSGFIVVIFAGLWHIARYSAGGQHTVLIRLLVAGILAYMTVAFFSFPRERIFHQVVLYSFFGLMITLTHRPAAGLGTSYFHFIWMALIGCVVTYVGYEWYSGEVLARKLNGQRAAGDWPALLKTYDKAEDLHLYKMDATSVPLSFYSGLAYLNLNDFENSQRAFTAAYARHPHNIHVLNNLANIYYLQGATDSAVVYYKKALDVSPKYLDGALNLMAAYYNGDHPRKAYAVLVRYESIFASEAPHHPTLATYRQAILIALRDVIAQEEAVSLAYLDGQKLEEWHFEAIESHTSLERRLQNEAQKK